VLADVTRSTDNRYNPISKYFRDAGTLCFAGDSQVCRELQEYALEWAVSGGPDFYSSFGSTMTMNMRLLNPMISALPFAEADQPMAPDARRTVDAWLKKKVDEAEHEMQGDYEGRKHGLTDGIHVRKAAHNHSVQSSLAAMSYGAWTGDDNYFKTGLDQWFITLGSARPDGSLPIETRRGSAALYYQGRTISGLVQLAERARTQGIDLYGQAPNPSQTIHHVVKFFLDAVENPELVLPYAAANYAARPGPRFADWKRQNLGGSGSALGWVTPYVRQFPNHENIRRMKAFTFEGSYLVRHVVRAVNLGGYSAEWIGVNARCFYSSVGP